MKRFTAGMKKVAAIILAMVLMLAVLPTTSFADFEPRYYFETVHADVQLNADKSVSYTAHIRVHFNQACAFEWATAKEWEIFRLNEGEFEKVMYRANIESVEVVGGSIVDTVSFERYDYLFDSIVILPDDVRADETQAFTIVMKIDLADDLTNEYDEFYMDIVSNVCSNDMVARIDEFTFAVVLPCYCDPEDVNVMDRSTAVASGFVIWETDGRLIEGYTAGVFETLGMINVNARFEQGALGGANILPKVEDDGNEALPELPQTTDDRFEERSELPRQGTSLAETIADSLLRDPKMWYWSAVFITILMNFMYG